MPEIVKTEGVLGGKARVQGRRISAFQIGQMYLEGGYAPEEIADQLELSLAEVHRALSYYYDNPEEMRAIRDRDDSLVQRLAEESKAPETPSP
jgi:uncharacterized protein (DUF433 family)